MSHFYHLTRSKHIPMIQLDGLTGRDVHGQANFHHDTISQSGVYLFGSEHAPSNWSPSNLPTGHFDRILRVADVHIDSTLISIDPEAVMLYMIGAQYGLEELEYDDGVVEPWVMPVVEVLRKIGADPQELAFELPTDAQLQGFMTAMPDELHQLLIELARTSPNDEAMLLYNGAIAPEHLEYWDRATREYLPISGYTGS